MKHTITAYLLAVASFSVSAAPQREPAPLVQRQTAFGPVVGSDLSAASGTYSWKGVPFAKPPVGALRWKAPVAPDAWTSPLATKRFGPACLQTGRIYGPGANNTFDATIAATPL